jgi:hypothetical protein
MCGSTPEHVTTVSTAPDSWEGRLPPDYVRELTHSDKTRALWPTTRNVSCASAFGHVAAGRVEDCPWCAMGEGSVQDCWCGMRVCAVCADVAEGDCSCGHELGMGM